VDPDYAYVGELARLDNLLLRRYQARLAQASDPERLFLTYVLVVIALRRIRATPYDLKEPIR
jgi:hypothetical protein